MVDDEKSLIQTERLVIEYINKKYINNIFDEKNNPEVNQYLSSQSAKTIEELEQRIAGVMEKNGKEDVAQFQVSKKESNEFIGLCVVKKINTPHPEIGLRIKQSARGMGYGKEMVGGLINRIQKNMEYEYIIYETFEDNVGSIKIIESLGGVLQSEYEMKNNYYGVPLKHIQYRIYYTKPPLVSL